MNADPYLWTMIALGSIMSFAIGSNETDALATTYSSGALSMIACVILL
jgi:phosphate/sulfate permease